MATISFEENVRLVISTLVIGLAGDQMTEEQKNKTIERCTKQIMEKLPQWKPAARAYDGDRLPRCDFMLNRLVARDEEGIFYLKIDELYTLPKNLHPYD